MSSVREISYQVCKVDLYHLWQCRR